MQTSFTCLSIQFHPPYCLVQSVLTQLCSVCLRVSIDTCTPEVLRLTVSKLSVNLLVYPVAVVDKL